MVRPTASLMDNHLFRYLAEENMVSAENIERIRKIMALPMADAQELTEDELNEDFNELAIAE